jgi:hypothetical protein
LPSISGELTTDMSTRTFVGGDIPDSSYDFQQPASVSAAVGTLDTVGGGPTLSIAADGSATLSFASCQASGQVAPRADGKNLLTLSAAPCPGGTFAYEGVVLIYERMGGGKRQLADVFASDGWDCTNTS